MSSAIQILGPFHGNVFGHDVRNGLPEMYFVFCLCMMGGRCHRQLHAHFPLRVRLGAQTEAVFSKKSPTGPIERIPKPEYLVALATYLGVRW